MGKVKCRRCGDIVSSDTGKCPHCYSSLDYYEEPKKHHNLAVRYIIASILLLFMFFSILGHYSFLKSEGNFNLDGYQKLFAAILSLTINFALASVIPLLIKIFNRDLFLKKCSTIYFLNASILYVIYKAFYDYISPYYSFTLTAMLIYSAISYLFFYNPNEEYEQDIYHIFEDDDEEEQKINKTNDKDYITDDKSTFDDKYEKLNKLKELYDNDILTKEEFEEEKKKILK